MKISSQGSMGDIMAVGVNVAEQTKNTSSVPDFKSYMQQSAPNKESQNVHNVPSVVKNQDAQTESSKRVDDRTRSDSQTIEGKQTEDAARSEHKGTEGVSNSKNAEDISDVEETPAVDGEVSEEVLTEMTEVLVSTLPMTQVMELLSNIQNQIQELLGIDTEKFNQLLSSLDMQLSDLLDGEAQKQFLLAAEDAKPIDLLTNEQLAGLLSQMGSMIDEAVSVSDIEATTLQSAIEQLHAMKSADVQDNAVQDTYVQADDTMESVDGSHIQFTVEMDTESDSRQEAFQGEQTDMSSMREQVLGQLNQTVGQLAEVTEVSETVTPAEIVDQVVEQIKLTVRQDTTSMELQLYPEHLGKVAVQVSTRNGAVTAQITAENEMARAALESSIQSLKETFQNQGLKVEAVEVMVATSSFSQEQFMNQQTEQDTSQAGKGTRRINLEELEDLESDDLLTEAEQLNVDMMRQEGRSVDYTA